MSTGQIIRNLYRRAQELEQAGDAEGAEAMRESAWDLEQEQRLEQKLEEGGDNK